MLWITRHGKTHYNLERIVQTHLNDEKAQLTPEGIEDSKRKGKIITTLFPDTKKINSSPRDRAFDTAYNIASCFYNNASIIVDDNLRDRSYGHWDGIKMDEIEDFYPEEYRRWRQAEKTRDWSFKLPTHRSAEPGTEPESRRDVYNRVKPIIDTCIEDKDITGIVTHNDASQVILSYLLETSGQAPKESYKFKMKNEDLFLYDNGLYKIDDDKRVKSWNGTN